MPALLLAYRSAKVRLHLAEMFSTDFENLHDDGVVGSQDEHSNFTEVFVGNDTGSTSKRWLVTGAVNFEGSKNPEASPCSNSANSAVISRSFSKKLRQEDTNAINESCGWVSASGIFPKRFALAEREDQNVSFKRIKFSTGEVSRGEEQKKKALSTPLQKKEIVSGLPSTPKNSVDQRVALHLVESSSVEMEDIEVTKSRIQNSDAGERKEVVVGKAIASPVSQENFSLKLVVSSPAIAVEKFESPFCAEERRNLCPSFGGDSSVMSGATLSKKDPRPLLRNLVFHVLKGAGWSIERHKRPSRSYWDTVYRPPDGRLFYEFPKVWRFCGQVLLANEYYCMLENDVKKWTDMIQFWSDLLETLLNIEKEVNQTNLSTALARHWTQLDPFGKMPTQYCDSSLAAKSSLTAAESSFDCIDELSGNETNHGVWMFDSASEDVRFLDSDCRMSSIILTVSSIVGRISAIHRRLLRSIPPAQRNGPISEDRPHHHALIAGGKHLQSTFPRGAH
ncbi:Acyl-CoA N-acyltransferase with RING/FYVE/PHD-type zinc finger protein, putative isoform 2 [Hibiscus syriacus]|uniref:Acyl-CoA N-acyltransferase with RING/FYVE/PHD-type zinc finger protein, putative isoform 2 n=1 Tax=Hibiscus syriacus TaxID=106335 RepID=A0A6A2YGN7_HIBSY|nr:Acyl-CoA N-acyltransferase with RING/FYVE/PHD-type zinc finger protein, putative isoform 2 [Hibiscus syriacus]